MLDSLVVIHHCCKDNFIWEMTGTDSTLPIGDLRLLHDFIIPSSWQIVPGRIKSAVGIGALLLDGLG